MKKIALTLAMLGGLTAVGSHDASAQYSGPSATSFSTVADVLANAKDDAPVHLTGKITQQVGSEKYIFADDTGEIRVDIDSDDFTVAVDDNTVVEIRGEVEKDFMQSPEIDVDSLIVSTKQ